MSFPNIPDIDPCINITLEDATNLLLTSIALEEVSLSKLMDAETNKICCVLKQCKHENSMLRDTLDINKSVDNTVKNIIKLQMLLQFKLENVLEIVPTTTVSTSTTTTYTTTCTTSTCSTTTQKCRCSLIGEGKGCISNKCDEFFGQNICLEAIVINYDYKNRSIRYFVQKYTESLQFVASAYSIKIECPSSAHSDKIVIYGKGFIEKKSKCNFNIFTNGTFVLKVWKEKYNKIALQMVISSDDEPKFYHDSGYVQINDSCSNLKLQWHC